MRLFVAIQLNEDIKSALIRMQAEMRRRGTRGNFTAAENLHLTLAFIGEYPDPEHVLEAMGAVPFAPFPLRIEGLGQFGDLWWVGLSRSEALSAYVRRLRHVLSEAAIPFDGKKFSPHITIVRRAVSDRRQGLPGASVPDAGMEVRYVCLMRSDRGKNGMIYTELGRVAPL